MTSSTVPGDQSFRDSSTYPEWDTDGATRRHSRATVSAAVPSHGPLLVDIVDTMKMRDVGIVVLAASLTTAGLVYLHERPPDRPAAAQVVGEVTCLDPGMFPGHFPPPLPQSFTPPRSGTVPDGFHPVAVVTCDFASGRTYFGADGQNPAGEALVVNEVRREGDLGELLGAMAARSDPQAWGIEAWWGGKPGRGPTDYRCTPGTTCALLWLVDRDGRAIRPSIPVDRSGADKVDGRYAIARLPVVSRIEHRLDVPTTTG